MAKNYIYSTLSSSVKYECEGASILIKGGANIPNVHMLTPKGVVTEVTDEELVLLGGNSVFQLHKANGYIHIDKKEHKVENVIADMTRRDNAAPDTEKEAEKLEKETGVATKVKKKY